MINKDKSAKAVKIQLPKSGIVSNNLSRLNCSTEDLNEIRHLIQSNKNPGLLNKQGDDLPVRTTKQKPRLRPN